MLALAAVAVAVVLGMGGYTVWYAKGLSYLSSDPAACVNCHVMSGHFESWGVSSHKDVACNECHVPHDLVGKYVAKAEHGFRHSAAFTLQDVQAIRITDRSLEHVQHNCVRCHEQTVSFIVRGDELTGRFCTRCHAGAGHVL